jgi:hypothetical protein
MDKKTLTGVHCLLKRNNYVNVQLFLLLLILRQGSSRQNPGIQKSFGVLESKAQELENKAQELENQATSLEVENYFE